jgi:hypothetical protein
MNPESKQQLIDWLFNMIGTEHFNMSGVVGSTLFECGTTLCLLGAAEALAFQQDISYENLAEMDYRKHLDQIEACLPEDYDPSTYHRALEWLGLDHSTDWDRYSLFFVDEWPQPYQKIYFGNSNICNYIDENVCRCKNFIHPLAGILLLTDMPDDEDGCLDGIKCNDDESFYKRHEHLIQQCISKFKTSLSHGSI